MRLRPSSGVWGVVGCFPAILFATLVCGSGRGLAQAPAAAPPAAPPAAGAPAGAPAAPPAAPPGGAPAAGPAEAPAPGGALPTGPASDPAGYTVRLRHLERSVSELKEQVFRTKARLQLLKETVLGGVIGASRAVIRHKNEMGATFRLVKAVYALDGVQIFSKADDSGQLSEMKEFDVYNGAIQPGSHTVSVNLIYQGHGFGVFSYLKGYKFTVKGSQNFVANEGRSTALTIVGYEKGGALTNMEDKPALDFRVNTVAGEAPPAAQGQR
jgi:hypothetical protein